MGELPVSCDAVDDVYYSGADWPLVGLAVGFQTLGIKVCVPVDLLFISSDAGDMARGDVAESQRRPQVDTASGVVAAHDAGHVTSRRIQAGDGPARVVEDLGVLIDLEPGESAETTRFDFHGIERPLFNRRDAGVGLLQRIALFAVVGRRASAELRVLAIARVAVVVRHGGAQANWVDAAGQCQFLQGLAAFQITAADEG